MTTTAATPTHTAAVLANAAFGNDPGHWPLPAATTPEELWLRAVVAGGQGRYSSAVADLAGVCRAQRTGALVSLAHSTHASFQRQRGWHTDARRWDGKAWALARADPEAGADALIGLAADALGVGRFAVSACLLERAHDAMSDGVPERQRVRLAWVSAELAMARGEGGAAVDHAERAVDLAVAFGSTRHSVKSDVIFAAALCSAGELERSRCIAGSAMEAAGSLGMIPLRWASACLLADIGSATHSSPRVIAIRDECADTLRRRGGVWSDH